MTDVRSPVVIVAVNWPAPSKQEIVTAQMSFHSHTKMLFSKYETGRFIDVLSSEMKME